MWRWLWIAALSGVFLPLLGWGQARGGGAGFGARTGMGFHASGIGFRSPSAGFPRGQWMPRPVARGGVRFVSGPFLHNCLGRPCAARWWWGSGCYPYAGWWYWDAGGYDSSSVQPYYPAANSAATEQIEQQQAEIDQLREEVAELRQGRTPASAPEPARETESKPTQLIFRDRHTEDVENYAIMGQSLWILTSGKARKIPLSDLDVAATKKVNADRGVEFRTPL